MCTHCTHCRGENITLVVTHSQTDKYQCNALNCLHCTALLCTALHCTELHCTALHCTALHCTALLTCCTVSPPGPILTPYHRSLANRDRSGRLDGPLIGQPTEPTVAQSAFVPPNCFRVLWTSSHSLDLWFRHRSLRSGGCVTLK